jgi:hypothetical protein
LCIAANKQTDEGSGKQNSFHYDVLL